MGKKRLKINVNSIILLIGILVVAGVLIYGGNAGWFKSITQQEFVTNSQTINKLDNTNIAGPECSMSFNYIFANVGDTVVGTITDGANSKCKVYSKKGNEAWKLEFEGTTDVDGKLVGDRLLEEEAVFLIKSICGEGTAKECVTNTVTLTVGARDCNKECIESNYKSGVKMADCSTCVGADKQCLTVFESKCCCTLKESYPEEPHTLLTCMVYANADGNNKVALGIFNSADCTTHANSQCPFGVVSSKFYSPNCCGWKCVDGISVEQCSVETGNANYNHFNQDPRSASECTAMCGHFCEIMTKNCASIYWLPPNCCIWNCIGE